MGELNGHEIHITRQLDADDGYHYNGNIDRAINMTPEEAGSFMEKYQSYINQYNPKPAELESGSKSSEKEIALRDLGLL